MSPLVSVIIPSYNYGKYLIRAIDSLLVQTYKNLEIIIVDDASTDNTKEIVAQYNYKNLIYYRHSINMGVSNAIYTGQKHVKGEYLCVLAADDTLDINSIELRLNFLQNNKLECVHTGLTKIYKQKNIYIPPLDTNNLKNIIDFLKNDKQKCGINSATFLYKTDILNRINFRTEDKKYFPNEDYEFSLRILANCITGFINESTYNYFIHDGSHLNTFGKSLNAKENLKRLKNEYIEVFKKRIHEN